MAQEDDLRALGKIMDFLRAVSIILAIMNVAQEVAFDIELRRKKKKRKGRNL